MDERRKAIKRKNQAFEVLMDGYLKCERKKHTSGEVPPEWSARLAELEAEYEEAVESWRKKKWRNSTHPLETVSE